MSAFTDLNSIVPTDIPGITQPGVGFTEIATRFANVAIIIAVGLSTIAMAYSFVMFITSSGDPKASQKAKRSLTWAVVALLVAIAAWSIRAILLRWFGLSTTIA